MSPPAPPPSGPGPGGSPREGPGQSRPGHGGGPQTGAVDAHHHLWDPARRSYPWLEGEALAPIRRAYDLQDLRGHVAAAGVERTVLVQTVPDVSETRNFLQAASGSDGLIAGVVGWVDLTHVAVPATLDALRNGAGGDHLVGIRHQVEEEEDPEWLLRPDVMRGLRAVHAAGLVYDLLVKPHQLAAATVAVGAVPGARFVLDHAAKPPVRSGELEPWGSALRRLAGHENVTCKLSGLVTEADWQAWQVADLRPFVELVLEAFGPQRVMAGSDWPVCELAASYGRVWEVTEELLAGLSSDERQQVMTEVAVRTYAL